MAPRPLRRERPAVIEALGKGMLLTTLRYGSTVRKAETVFDEVGKAKIDEDMVDLTTHLIDRKKIRFDPSGFEDHYQNVLLDLIKAKQAGKKAPIVRPETKPSNVIDLFAALKKSLASEDGGRAVERKAPAKCGPSARGKSAASRTSKRKSA